MALMKMPTYAGGGSSGFYGTFTSNASVNGTAGIDIGFAPSHVFVYFWVDSSYGTYVLDLDVANSKIYGTFYVDNHVDVTADNNLYMKTPTYLELKTWTNIVANKTCYVLAIP